MELIIDIYDIMRLADMVSGRWMERKRTIEGIKRNIIHSLFSVPTKENAGRLLLLQHTSNDHPHIFHQHTLL
jgi:hypothetical protein